MSDLFMLLFFICICISFYFFIKFFIAIFKKREKKKNFKKAIFVLLLGFLCGVIATHFMPKEKNNFQHVAIQVKEDQKIAEKEQKTQNIEQNVKSEPKINIKKEDTKTAIPQYTYTITHQFGTQFEFLAPSQSLTSQQQLEVNNYGLRTSHTCNHYLRR